MHEWYQINQNHNCSLLKSIIIYDRIESGQYYKTMITIVSYAPNFTLALSSVVNYDRKWRHNLERH